MRAHQHIPWTNLIEELENYEGPVDIEHLAHLAQKYHIRSHLAVLTSPYLEKVIDGTKTIESRFTRSRVLPFQQVYTNDVLFLKKTAGPIQAIAIVASAECFGPLQPGEATNIMDKYQEGLQLGEEFKNSKQESRYATLITLEKVQPIKWLQLKKKDRRPWVIITEGTEGRTEQEHQGGPLLPSNCQEKLLI